MPQRTIRIHAIVEEEDHLILYGDNPGYALLAPVTAAVKDGGWAWTKRTVCLEHW